MQQWLEQIKKAFPDNAEFPERMVVAAGALAEAARYAADKGWRSALLVADGNTFEAAGRKLADELAGRGVTTSVTLVKPNPAGDVVADEASVVQVLLDLQQKHPDVLMAVGSGTLHDITRYSAFTAGKPFVSVPTAPSVDGFNSKGAPLLIRGEKITIQSIGPVALFADAEVLLQAPRLMTAAGFGDMLGKATSLFDWRIGRMYADEPYSDEVANITRQALERTIRSAEDIGQGKGEAILDLMRALLESGIAMLIFGQSHPASGAEHHLSHYWEMAFIRSGRRQLLHGAKVGVACGMIADLYHAIGRDKPELESLLAGLPTGDRIREWLAAVGAPTTPEELGIEEVLVRQGVAEAHKVRLNRTTLLRLHNEGKLEH